MPSLGTHGIFEVRAWYKNGEEQLYEILVEAKDSGAKADLENCKQILEVINHKIWFYINLKLLKFQTIAIVDIRKQVVICEACYALILRCFI